MKKIILISLLLALPLVCYAQDDNMLLKEGYIRVAGGCFVYLKGEIIFMPQNGNIKIIVNNSEGYFRDKKFQSIGSFEVVLSKLEFESFLLGLKAVLDSPQPTKDYTTRFAVVKIYLPLQSETINTEWKEEGDFAIDPLLAEIEEFVLKCYSKMR